MESNDLPEVSAFVGELDLTMGQKFELERMIRTIEACDNLEELKSLTKQLTTGWMTQKATIAWLIRQNLDKPPSLVEYRKNIQRSE